MYRQRLLEALRRVRDEGPFLDHAICNQLGIKGLNTTEVYFCGVRLRALFVGFLVKEGVHLENIDYPVGGPIEYQEEKMAGTLWNNPRRHELLHYCINRLDQELNLG